MFYVGAPDGLCYWFASRRNDSRQGNGTGQALPKPGSTSVAPLAIILSWSANKSILWAIVHGFLSGIYVIYDAIRHQ